MGPSHREALICRGAKSQAFKTETNNNFERYAFIVNITNQEISVSSMLDTL